MAMIGKEQIRDVAARRRAAIAASERAVQKRSGLLNAINQATIKSVSGPKSQSAKNIEARDEYEKIPEAAVKRGKW